MTDSERRAVFLDTTSRPVVDLWVTAAKPLQYSLLYFRGCRDDLVLRISVWIKLQAEENIRLSQLVDEPSKASSPFTRNEMVVTCAFVITQMNFRKLRTLPFS